MKFSRLIVVLAFLFACSFATLAFAKGSSSFGSCPGVSATTVKQAQAATFAAACAAGQSCASNSANCKKAALQASLKSSFMSIMTTFNIGPFCAGAIVLSVAQSGADGSLSPLACK